MALRISCSSATTSFNFNSTSISKFPFSPFTASFPNPNSIFSTIRITLCHASNSNPRNKHSSSSSSTTKKKKKKTTTVSDPLNFTDFEILQDFPAGVDVNVHDDGTDSIPDSSLAHASSSLPLPEPPAGFVVDGNGKVVQALTDRLVTIVDPTNNLPLECVVRRVFRSSEGHDCMLLCPVDTPIQILKSTNADGWSAVSDKEVESILPAAAYALAKIHMHLVYSGYCYTARGGFCYTEEDIFDFQTDEGKGVDGLPTEAIEITYFDLEGAQYMIYTPSDPHLFVAQNLFANPFILLFLDYGRWNFYCRPIQILKSTNADGWSAVSDKEVESILPAAAYALAKIHMHLVYSGYCYTARGGFCYTEEDIFDFQTDEGKGVDGLPTEAIEITYFDLEGAQYMIYTPSDPHLFVAVKDQNGMLQVADDELLEDPAIFDAIDEETEFNALAEEESALLESVIDS
ncbi:hypothetical protein TanjilG_02438 [Lupinus angustifolius]|uniref:Uncharacterized protein n=1 Tax=Lupinus angustifolius TaxID=3871 RepID=A0A1J7IGM8_LUPAN|nr:hypothetical protein TanjilG_02438 [Lupinus angustifolius]